MKASRATSGFSLIELMVSMSIATLLGLVAVGGVAQIYKQVTNTEKTMRVDEDAKLLTEVLVADMQAVGGASVRPFMGIFFEDGDSPSPSCDAAYGVPACSGNSDRVTLRTYDSTHPFQCPTIDYAAGVLTIGDIENPAAPPAMICCLDVAGSDWENRHAVVSSDNLFEAVRLGSKQGGCTIDAPLATFDQATVATDLTLAGWQSGTMVAVDQRTLFHDDATNELKVFRDADRDGAAQPDEISTLAVHVYDVQFALGFDIDGDGTLTNTADENDEWWGNHDNDLWGSDGLALANPRDLRMVRAGSMLGAKVARVEPNSVRVFNGMMRQIDGVRLRGSVGTAFVRNLSLFY